MLEKIILDHHWDQRFPITKSDIWPLDLIFMISDQINPTRWASCFRQKPEHPSNSWFCSGWHGRDCGEGGEGRHGRARACRTRTVLAWSKPIQRHSVSDLYMKKDCQRTSPAEENIVFGEPESYWKKILRHCVVSSTIQRENRPPGARIQWHDSHEAIKHDWYAILTSA